MASALEVGRLYVPESADVIRDYILTDIRLEARKTSPPGVEPAVQPGTDDYRWATAMANAAMLQYSNIANSRDALTPLYAAGEDLENWRISLGIPEVMPSPSTGKIVLKVNGSSSISDGEAFHLPNGLRGHVVGTYLGVVDKAEVAVATDDTGSATELQADSEVQFVSPPTNIDGTAKVSRNSPLRGGTDEESEDRKRVRVLNTTQNKPAGGNWGDIRQVVLDELASVQDAYPYPALGGPSSVKVVPVRDYDTDENDFSRAFDSAALSIIQNAIFRDISDGNEYVVQAVADQAVDVAIEVEIPASVLAGGDGTGWVDSQIWPALVGGDAGKVTVTTVTSSTQVTVSAGTSTAPIAGQTHVAWWSSHDRKFRTYLVTAVSGSAGAWVITLDRPLVDDSGTSVATGEYIGPAAVNSEGYGRTWIDIMRKMGPGENTADANRLPRSLRHPYATDETPGALTLRVKKQLVDAHNEISDGDWSYRSLTAPTVPATVANAPNVLVPRHFGLYAQ